MGDLIDKIREAGVIGMGGAGFPTHVKLSGQGIEQIIVNGFECEPLLGTDRYVMRHFAPRLVSALTALKQETGAAKATFALKEGYHAEIDALKAAIAEKKADIGVHTTTSFYPAGDEQVVVYEVTGRTVPPLNIPLAVGCVVINAGTLLACYDAMQGEPSIARVLTVTGEVKTPCVLTVPVGTPFSDCIAAVGGVTDADCVIVSGGPMMGKEFTMDALPRLFVGKTTSGILILPRSKYQGACFDMDEIHRRAKSACIQCTYCTELCPRHLLGHPLEPHRIMRKLAYGKPENLLDDPVIRSSALCSECGVCEVYACPMGLQPRSVNAFLKRSLAQAGIRYPKSEKSTEPDRMRSARKAPTARIAARAGVLAYYGKPLQELTADAPKQVALSLRQGIGAPSEPIVKAGDRVEAGQCIARCPEGKLGAQLHASIGGRVLAVNDAIVIEREDGR